MFERLVRRPTNIQTIYLSLVLGNTLAASFIWGINTIFLLDAGLSNFQAFLANAFFTLGQVIFEVPTGIIADTYGRRLSYLLGALTLSISTAAYLYMWVAHGPFIGWVLTSILLGLGFTFFSGATEAWLVDALHATGFKGGLDSVFAKGQMIGGIAMLGGATAGGVIAQITNLGVPYILRSVILIINFLTAFFLMKDLGFQPKKGERVGSEMKKIWSNSIKYGIKNPPVRYIMLSSPLIMGISFYTFYALQPFLLNLYGNEKAYSVAGLVAAFVGLSNIIGGLAASRVRKLFKRRTTFLLVSVLTGGIILALASGVHSFYLALILIFIWGLLFASLMPIRQAYVNGMIPSEQRATVLSFDSMLGSSGGVVVQPALGKIADVSGYPASYFASAIIQLCSLPLIFLSRKQNAKSDKIEQ